MEWISWSTVSFLNAQYLIKAPCRPFVVWMVYGILQNEESLYLQSVIECFQWSCCVERVRTNLTWSPFSSELFLPPYVVFCFLFAANRLNILSSALVWVYSCCLSTKDVHWMQSVSSAVLANISDYATNNRYSQRSAATTNHSKYITMCTYSMYEKYDIHSLSSITCTV